MQTFKSSIRVKAIAWILSICLIITLIPDIGYATEAVNTSEATVTEEVESDAGEQIHDGNDPMTELDPETANDPAMAGLTEDNVVVECGEKVRHGI